MVARVTELRERTHGPSIVGDLGGPRGRELAELASEFIAQREELLEANRTALAEATAAFEARTDDAPLGTREDLERPDLTVRNPTLRTARLDALERALEEMSRRSFGVCARCSALISVDRLRRAPDARTCEKCALAAGPES